MADKETSFERVADYLDGIKKSYQKLKESCTLFEQEHKDFCLRIGLDLDAFNLKVHPEHPAEGIFQMVNLSDRDRQMLGEYLGNREKMYLLELCVRNIDDEDTRRLAEAYYLERKTQLEIASEIDRTKSYVSKHLDKAEKGVMADTIDSYFAWKYNVPGGKTCCWAGKWEKQYMWNQDLGHGIIPRVNWEEFAWMKNIRRMGFR